VHKDALGTSGAHELEDCRAVETHTTPDRSFSLIASGLAGVVVRGRIIQSSGQ